MFTSATSVSIPLRDVEVGCQRDQDLGFCCWNGYPEVRSEVHSPRPAGTILWNCYNWLFEITPDGNPICAGAITTNFFQAPSAAFRGEEYCDRRRAGDPRLRLFLATHGHSEDEHSYASCCSANEQTTEQTVKSLLGGPMLRKVYDVGDRNLQLPEVRLKEPRFLARELHQVTIGLPLAVRVLHELPEQISEVGRFAAEESRSFTLNRLDERVRQLSFELRLLLLRPLHVRDDLLESVVCRRQDLDRGHKHPTHGSQGQSSARSGAPERDTPQGEAAYVGEAESRYEDRAQASEDSDDPLGRLPVPLGRRPQPTRISLLGAGGRHGLALARRGVSSRVGTWFVGASAHQQPMITFDKVTTMVEHASSRSPTAGSALVVDGRGLVVRTKVGEMRQSLGAHESVWRDRFMAKLGYRTRWPRSAENQESAEMKSALETADQAAQTADQAAHTAEVDFSGTAREWSVERVRREGVVSVRELSQHTTQVLKCLEERGRPVFVTRYGKIVATMTPTSMRVVVDSIIANDAGHRDSMTSAEQALAEGKTRSARDVIAEIDARESE